MNTLKQPQQSDTQRIAIHKGKSSNNQVKRYIVKQRACGMVLLIAAILSMVISQDSTASLILVPIALYIMITKKHVMCF